MDENKPFWLEFIRMYRSLPCLWKLDCPEYTNRIEKTKAYMRLVKKLQVRYPNADRDFAVKKINNLRTNYRREWKKVKESIMTASDEMDIYVPALWYYNEMSFLDEQQVITKKKKSIKVENEMDADMDNDRTMEHVLSPSKIPLHKSVNNHSSTPWNRKSDTFPKPNRIEFNEENDPLLTSKTVYVPNRSIDNNSEDIIEYWRTQYTKLEPKQKILCRKMISDVLFHSSLGELEDAHVTKMQEILLQRTETYSQNDIIDMNSSRSSTPNGFSSAGIKDNYSNEFLTQNTSQSIENLDSISHSSEEVTQNYSSVNTVTPNDVIVSFSFEVKANLKLMIKLNWSSDQIIDALKEVYEDKAPTRKELIQLVQQLQESDDEE